MDRLELEITAQAQGEQHVVEGGRAGIRRLYISTETLRSLKI